jgi:hypothetical protein
MPLAGITTLIVPVPAAEALVGKWRARNDWSAALGVPAHVTVLGPFLPPVELSPEVVERLRLIFSRQARFKFALSRVRQVGGVVYLAPEPVAPFEQLTATLRKQWPQAPPYGAAFESTVYHLTVTRRSSLLEQVRQDLTRFLPVEAEARQVHLFERTATDMVRTVGRFPLRGRTYAEKV